MSGILMATMAGSGGGHLTGSAGTIVNTSAATGVRSGVFTLVNDGTFTQTGNAAGNWFTPTTAGTGSTWSAKAVINSQVTTNTTGTFGSFISLSAGTNWTFANTLSSNEATGNMTISFSPDGGATTVGTMGVTWDVGFAP